MTVGGVLKKLIEKLDVGEKPKESEEKIAPFKDYIEHLEEKYLYPIFVNVANESEAEQIDY